MFVDSPSRRSSASTNMPPPASPGNGGSVWKDTDEYGGYIESAGPDSGLMRPAATGQATAVANQGGHQDITIGALGEDDHPGAATKHSYSGRKVVWPGALLLLLISAASVSAITYFAVEKYQDTQEQVELSEEILGPLTGPRANHTSIPIKVCTLPDYVTDGGKLYATGGDKKEKHEVHFTGINWSGMENKEGVPHGLAMGQTDLDTLAKKLAKMDINAVRLPLNAKMIIENAKPDTKNFVSPAARDLQVSSYMDMIRVIVQGLAKQQIAVLLDIHKIDPEFKKDTSEHLWYTDKYPFRTMLKMYKTLATELCNDLQYNIIGLDIKNEPVGGCWPADDGDSYCDKDKNWPRAVEQIGNAILGICPNWLIVVEGLYATGETTEINGKNATYSDWYGASLQNASINPIKLDVPDKVVFAPHFYSPSVYPTAYFFEKQKTNADGSVDVTEFPDTKDGSALLKSAVEAVLDKAFGDTMASSGIPTFYGEFGGIYGEAELLKGKTSTRVIDILIEYADTHNMTGGFSWALNPDGEYDFNDEYNTKDPWHFGLYATDKWEDYNEDYAKGLRKLKGNGVIPCLKSTLSGGVDSGSTDGQAGSTQASTDASTTSSTATDPTSSTATDPTSSTTTDSATASGPSAETPVPGTAASGTAV